MELNEIVEMSKGLGAWVHLATVSPSGMPYVTPVHPCWEDETLWTMVGTDSVKAKNIAANPRVSCHWQVTEDNGFDGLMLWGTGQVFDDLETKRRLWEGVFDYDLGGFAPGGPDDSPGTGFLALTPTKAVFLKEFGAGGREVWRA